MVFKILTILKKIDGPGYGQSKSPHYTLLQSEINLVGDVTKNYLHTVTKANYTCVFDQFPLCILYRELTREGIVEIIMV